MASIQPCGVHLVGSICLPSSEDVFRQATTHLPGRLRRIPDGETQLRQSFTFFQQGAFKDAPEVLKKYDASFNPAPVDPVSPEELEAVVNKLGDNIQTSYDVYAKESYATFCKLREEGVIPKGVKFQVSMPCPVDVLVLIAEPYQAALEPLYEAALIRDLKKIEENIPAEDLAIQWDIASPFAMMEGALWPHFKPYVPDAGDHIKKMAVRLGNAVSPGVELGFHLCYGDIGHRHFVEPRDLGLIVDIATAVFNGVDRQINWIHVSAPKERDDEAYFAPLKDLPLGNTELYLGVVQPRDEEGTRRRIAAASKVVNNFGIATECGMGRTPTDDFVPTMEIAAAVSAPVF
ncbi:hypothetical protein IWZ03DRAFT_13801 [Phyllosticta citriasiana]|uniref:Cobalamin-independent methionine synthase MetE C-terminal/archaeal domain-containing protein n=1 Tax=Phyllosticta citriasiana TaxID=595635 RepID=A0ABR1KYH3_9PEZI